MGHPLFGPTINPQYDTDRVFIRGSGGASPPAAPTLDSVTAGDTTNTVVWTPPAGSPTSYNLYWSLTSPVTTASNKLTGVTSPYVHTGRTNGVEVFYAVTAVKNSMESALSNEESGTPLSYILDKVAGTTLVAVSTRVLSTAWKNAAGKLRRVRRDSNGDELDIGFINGQDYDAANELTHCGAGSGYATVWYDQSGQANDFYMGASLVQPITCESGVLVAGPTTQRCANRHVPNRYCQSTNNIAPDGKSFLMVAIDDGAWDNTARGFWNTGNNDLAPMFEHFGNTYRMLYTLIGGADANWLIYNGLDINNWFVCVGVINGASSKLRVNGAEVTGNPGTSAASRIMQIGENLAGRSCEVIWWTGALNSQQIADAEANAKAYWGITW